MKTVGLVVIVAFLFAAFLFAIRRVAAQKPGSAAPTKQDPFPGLRQLAFKQSRASLHLPAGTKATEPFGAIMDWGTGSATVTIVAFADGSASIYFSTGGGFVGGHSHQTISDAAKNMVAVAARAQPHMTAASTFPLPKQGEVVLYVLTDAGVFSRGGAEEEFTSHRHVLSDLGDAAQNVITQYRLIQGKQSLPTN